MRKICFIQYDMSLGTGGGRVCTNLANTFCKKDFQIHILSIFGKGEELKFRLNSNVKYDFLFSSNKRIRDVVFEGNLKVRKYLKENKIDDVLVIGISAIPFLVFSSNLRNVKIILCEHTNSINPLINNRSQKVCRYMGVKLSDKIITLTKTDRDAYIQKFHLKPQNVSFIHNWIDSSLLDKDFNYNSSSKRIISAGRVESLKGIEKIIEVSRKLSQKYPDWQWHIFGTGTEEYVNMIKEKIEMYGLQEFVILKGNADDLYERYREYSMFVLLSYTEGLPMVLIEAKAKKLPLISFDCFTGPSEIIRDGIDGYLVPVDDIDFLYDRLDLCMSSEKHRVQLSNEAYGNIEKFSEDKILNDWLTILK